MCSDFMRLGVVKLMYSSFRDSDYISFQNSINTLKTQVYCSVLSATVGSKVLVLNIFFRKSDVACNHLYDV